VCYIFQSISIDFANQQIRFMTFFRRTGPNNQIVLISMIQIELRYSTFKSAEHMSKHNSRFQLYYCRRTEINQLLQT